MALFKKAYNVFFQWGSFLAVAGLIPAFYVHEATAQMDQTDQFVFRNGNSVTYQYSLDFSEGRPFRVIFHGSGVEKVLFQDKNLSAYIHTDDSLNVFIKKNVGSKFDSHPRDQNSDVTWFWDRKNQGYLILSDGTIQKSCLILPPDESTAKHIKAEHAEFILESQEYWSDVTLEFRKNTYIRGLPNGECKYFNEKFYRATEIMQPFQLLPAKVNFNGAMRNKFQIFQGESFEADTYGVEMDESDLKCDVSNEFALIPYVGGDGVGFMAPSTMAPVLSTATSSVPAPVTDVEVNSVEYQDEVFRLLQENSITYLVRQRDGLRLILSVRPVNYRFTSKNYDIKNGILTFPQTPIIKRVDLDRFDAEVRIFSKLSLPASSKNLSISDSRREVGDPDESKQPIVNVAEKFKDLVQEASEHPERFYQESDPNIMSQIAAGVWGDQSVALLGKAGTGKTSAVRAFARDVAQGKFRHIPRTLQIFQVDTSTLASGTTYTGQMEKRVKMLIAAAQETGCFYFFDEVHRLSGVGTHSKKSQDIIQDFKGPLEDGELRFLATSTTTEFYHTFETDPAIVERFKKIQIQAPVGERLVQAVKNKIYSNFGKRLDDSVIHEAIHLSNDHAPMTAQPRAAINLLKTGIAKKVEVGEFDAPFNQEDVRKAAVEAYLIPATYFEPMGLQAKLASLNATLLENFVGQTEAKRAIIKAWRNHFLGIKVGDRVNTVLFAGPPGVGKTSIAEKSAEIMGIDKTIIRMNELDLADPIEEFKRQVYMAVLKNPHQLIVLDEIEKAPKSVQAAALSMLQNGEFTVSDRHPNGSTITQDVNAKNILFIMTTNAGGFRIDRRGIKGKEVGRNIAYADLATALIEDGISEQIVSRVSSIVGLTRPSKDEFNEALTRTLARFLKSEGEKRGVIFELANKQEVLKAMRAYYDGNSDYRQITRLMEYVVDSIADLSLTHSFTVGETIDLQVSIPEPVSPEINPLVL